MEPLCESRMDGESKRWAGDRVVELANGQFWQQVRYRYEWRYAYSPVARGYRDCGRYLLDVDGMSDMVEARRVR